MRFKLIPRKLICYCVVVSLIFTGTVEITHLDYFSFIPTSAFLLAMVLFCSLGILLERRKSISKRALFLLLGLVIYLLLYLLITRINLKSYLFGFVTVFSIFYIYVYFLLKEQQFGELIIAYENVLVSIAIISLFFWLFGSVLDIIPGRYGTFTFADYQSKSYNYFYLYFENLRQNQQLLGSTLPRNCGIYCEAPAYAGMLFYAFLIETLYNKRKNNWKLIILIISLLSTQSTKALILLLFFYILQFVLKKNSGKSRSWLIIRFFVIFFIMIGGAFLIAYILEDKSNTLSFTARINHLVACFEAWKNNPLFGVGFKNTEAIVGYQFQGAGYGGLSMGVAVLLAEGGIVLTTFYVFPVIVAYYRFFKKHYKNEFFLFTLTLFMNLFISNSAFTNPYILMLSVLYALIGLSLLHKSNRKSVEATV